MSHFNSKQPPLSPLTLQHQFLHHCAVVIQARLRGYFQRKKYKAFLPIYRRVRELLSAVTAGWRLRRILKLQPVKGQIGEIRLKMRNGQVSAARIGKRELADEVERLSKKGRWMEVLLRCRMMKSKSMLDGKENSSLYGNIKSKSIKNVFKEQSKVERDRPKPTKLTEKEKQEVSVAAVHQRQAQDVWEEKKYMVDDYDQRPLKGTHSISLCPTQPEATPSTTRNQPSHSYLKKQSKPSKSMVCKSDQLKTNQSVTRQQPLPTKQVVSSRTNENNVQLQVMRASQVSKSSQASRKLQVTLIGSVKTIQSSKKISESTFHMKAHDTSHTSLPFSKSHPLQSSEVSKVYHEKYLLQKEKLISKLSSFDFTYSPGVGQALQQWLLKY